MIVQSLGKSLNAFKKANVLQGTQRDCGEGGWGEIYLKCLSSRQQQSLSIYIAYAQTTLCMYVAAAYLTYLRCGQVLPSESVTGIRQAEGQKESRTGGGNGHSVRQLSSICKR